MKYINLNINFIHYLIIMVTSKKIRKHSGRVSPKYIEKLPFKLREELDLFDERTFWDDWNDYRDGFREPIEKNRYKFLKKKNKLKKYPKYLFWHIHKELI